ncbi:DUF4344 domain-containing metallopeptidase [Streptomyces sp. NPDC054849]
MTTLGRAAAILAGCVAAVLPLSVTGFRKEIPDRGFVLRYETPATADRHTSRLLKDRSLAELTLTDLNAYIDLPHRVTVVARSCAGEGTAYDPEQRRIELCYDDLTEERELFERAGVRPPDEQLAGIVRETLHHEAGHALIDALGLPVRDQGRAEEDAADRFAQLMLLRGQPEGDKSLLTAAHAYDLAAAADPEPDPEDEHPPNSTRAESHRCAVYGAAPTRHQNLATPARAACPATWSRSRDAWLKDLEPLLRA